MAPKITSTNIYKMLTNAPSKPFVQNFVAHRMDLFRCLCWLQSAVLLLAGIAKLWMLLTDPFADLRTGFPINVLWLAVALEFAAAWYLVRRNDAGVQWFLMAVLFSAFLLISIARYLLGYSGCGCLGHVDIPRWILPANSVFVLLALLTFFTTNRRLFRFRESITSVTRKLRNPVVAGRVLAISVFVTGLLLPVFLASGINDLFDGKGLPNVRQAASSLRVGAAVQIDVMVPNRTNNDAVLIGSLASCNCLVVAEQKQTFSARQNTRIKVNVRPRKPGFFHQRVVCYIDHPEQDRLIVDVYGQVLGEE